MTPNARWEAAEITFCGYHQGDVDPQLGDGEVEGLDVVVMEGALKSWIRGGTHPRAVEVEKLPCGGCRKGSLAGRLLYPEQLVATGLGWLVPW